MSDTYGWKVLRDWTHPLSSASARCRPTIVLHDHGRCLLPLRRCMHRAECFTEISKRENGEILDATLDLSIAHAASKHRVLGLLQSLLARTSENGRSPFA